MINLGDKVTDCITGFTGVAVERVEYLAGSTFYGVQGRVEDNVMPEVEYIAEHRLAATLTELRMIKTGHVD